MSAPGSTSYGTGTSPLTHPGIRGLCPDPQSRGGRHVPCECLPRSIRSSVNEAALPAEEERSPAMPMATSRMQRVPLVLRPDVRIGPDEHA